MLFNNVKIGDKVFVSREVRYGFREHKQFYIQVDVDRVTKTQFAADSRRFKKDDGWEISGDWGQAAFPEGFKDEIYDQTEEMELFISRLKLQEAACQIAEEIVISVDNPNLPEIHSLLTRVSHLQESVPDQGKRRRKKNKK